MASTSNLSTTSATHADLEMCPTELVYLASEPQSPLKVVGVLESYPTMAVVANQSEQGEQSYHLLDGQSVKPENIIPLRVRMQRDGATRIKQTLQRLVDDIKALTGSRITIKDRLLLTRGTTYPLRKIATPTTRPTRRELERARDDLRRLKPRFRRNLTARDVFRATVIYCKEKSSGEFMTSWTIDDYIMTFRTWRRFGKLHNSNDLPSLSAFVNSHMNDKLLKNGEVDPGIVRRVAFDINSILIDHQDLLREVNGERDA